MPSLIQDMTKSRIPKYNATFDKIVRTPLKEAIKVLKDIIWKAETYCDFVQEFSEPLYDQNLLIWNKSNDLADFYKIFDEMHDKIEPISALTKKCLDRQRVVCLVYEQCVRKVGFIDIS
jgi:hypothetical protein